MKPMTLLLPALAPWLALAAIDDPPLTPPRFRAAPDSPIAVGPMAGRPAVGDVDGDGALDLVVACGTCCGSKPDARSGHVVVLRGDGKGAFAPWGGVAPSVLNGPIAKPDGTRAVPAGHTHEVAIADLDGDGRADLVTADCDSGDLTVLLAVGD